MSLTHTIAEIAQVDIAPPARDVCLTVPAAGPWPTLPEATEAADVYFARLVDEGRLEEATRFVAAWLGPRRAVWWATLCVWNGLRSVPPEDGDESVAAIDAAVAWIVDPTESNRRAAQAAAEQVGFATPAGAAATAAFWSEGSISLPGQPVVPPPPGVAVKAAANAVLMAAAAPSSVERDATLRQSLRIAAEILAGANLWTRGSYSMSPNNTNKALNTVLKTLDVLHRDLTAAQHGPMEPRLRSELTRLARTTANSSAQLADAHQAAAGQITAKKEAAAALAAANKAAIAAKQAAAQQPVATPPQPSTPPIDPTLGKLLADELLGRQPNRMAPEPPKHSQGVLDAWDWRSTALPILQ